MIDVDTDVDTDVRMHLFLVLFAPVILDIDFHIPSMLVINFKITVVNLIIFLQTLSLPSIARFKKLHSIFALIDELLARGILC